MALLHSSSWHSVLSKLKSLWLEHKYSATLVSFCGLLVVRKILDLVRRKWYKLPPGPIGMPFIGTVYEYGGVDKNRVLKKKYGPIYLTHFGFSTVCIVNDFKLMHKTFGRKEFRNFENFDLGYEKSFESISLKMDG